MKKSMAKRIVSLVFCLLVILQLASPAAKAEEAVFFTAMGESILPLTDESMPFISGNSIFIPAGIFTDAVRKSLDVSYTYNTARNLVILYRGSHALWFDLSTDYATDEEDTVYYPGAIMKNGKIFVSATLVARFFELSYSITEVNHGYMVWFRKPDYPLSDIRFADAASYNMESRYQEYLKTKTQQPTVEQPPASAETVMDGKRIYLCMQADAYVSTMLDTLDRAGAQAAVFFTPERMETAGDTLRRMSATGHSIGILADAALETDLIDQVTTANDALYDAALTRTRLVMVENAREDAMQTLWDAGCCVVTPDMDRTRYGLKTGAQADTLVQRISARRGNVTVWLGTAASSGGLRAFLRSVEQAEGSCRALTETE